MGKRSRSAAASFFGYFKFKIFLQKVKHETK
jgi:hypothetical protein